MSNYYIQIPYGIAKSLLEIDNYPQLIRLQYITLVYYRVTPWVTLRKFVQGSLSLVMLCQVYDAAPTQTLSWGKFRLPLAYGPNYYILQTDCNFWTPLTAAINLPPQSPTLWQLAVLSTTDIIVDVTYARVPNLFENIHYLLLKVIY